MTEIPRLIPMEEVQRLIPFSKVHIYRLMARDQFPRQVQVGQHRVAWVEDEIRDFVHQRIERREQDSP